MKNLKILISLFFICLLTSCSDVQTNNTNETSINEVIFEDPSLKTNISPNFYDNHFYLIEKLGYNSERTQIIDAVKENGIDLSTLDNKDIKKFYFNSSEILMYSISIKSSENKVIIYKYDDIYQVNKAEYFAVGDKMQFNLKTIDNNMFYSLQLDEEHKIGICQ